jgi:hypothetical protein
VKDTGGWIKLYRQIQKSWIWESGKPFDERSAWIDLLLTANHFDNKIFVDGDLKTIERGQFVTSVLGLAERWGWERKKVSKFLNALESDNMITQNRTTHGTTLTIVNYGFYQDCGTTDGTTKGQPMVQPKDNQRTTEGQRLPTNKNIKNNKNVKNDKECKEDKKEVTNVTKKKEQEVYFQEDDRLNQTFIDFLEMRKKAKIPTTDKAIELNVNKIRKFCTASDGNLDIDLAIYTIERSISEGWRGIFEPRDERKQLMKPKVHREPTKEPEKDEDMSYEEWVQFIKNSGE